MPSDTFYRTLLRRVATGASIVGLPLLGVGLIGNLGCACPTSSSNVHLSSARYAELVEDQLGDSQLPLEVCNELCRQVDSEVPEGWMVSSCSSHGGGALPRLECEYVMPCSIGRRLAGFDAPSARRGSVQARWMTDVALLEAEAVVAFDQLAEELEVHGAPASLIRGARRSAMEEVAHARATRALAEALGGHVPDVVHARQPLRSLEEVALDNAREGCVRETYGALVAAHQAKHAADPSHRRVFDRIARDEAGHGLFSLALADWVAPRVGYRLVGNAREHATYEMRAEIAEDPADDLRALGVPDAERANDLLALLPA